jgi:putative DNA primase/helicase
MVVDEIHHVEPKMLDAAVYSLTNGYGKSRGNIYACIRPTARWRVLVLSSGEMSCETRLYSGGLIVRGGQTVRMLDVPVEGKHGAFDDLHGFADAAAFSEALQRSTFHHYGHAGPAFVRKLIEENIDLDELLDKAMAAFSPPADRPPLNAIQRRAARTFGIMGLAGELATMWGLLPWEKGEALQSCVLLFRRWQKQMRASASDSPDAKIREVVANYIDRFGDSKFSNIEAGKGQVEYETRVLDRSGYWKDEPVPSTAGKCHDPVGETLHN